MSNEDWINHPGGFTPEELTGETWVVVVQYNGAETVGLAQDYRWSLTAPNPEAVIRYRVTQAPAEPEPDLGWVDWDMSGPGPSTDLDKIYIAEYRNGDVTPPMRMYMLKWGPQTDKQQEIVRYREPSGPVGGPDWGAPSRELHRVYPQYYKDVRHFDYIDVYATHRIWGVTANEIHHASKKLLMAGTRTGGKPRVEDITEARDTLNRWLELEQ